MVRTLVFNTFILPSTRTFNKTNCVKNVFSGCNMPLYSREQNWKWPCCSRKGVSIAISGKSTCIWKFAHRQSPHLWFRWRYRRILLGYQARIFHFSFFNVLHKSLSFITWNLIEYLHTQDLHRATAHLNVWTNILFCFVYGCKQHTKIS